MRRGDGHPDFPAKDGEGLVAHLHKVAKGLGYIEENVPEPGKAGPTKRPPAAERLDAIFGKTREPGEDDGA